MLRGGRGAAYLAAQEDLRGVLVHRALRVAHIRHISIVIIVVVLEYSRVEYN